jgi:hypothetical protein
MRLASTRTLRREIDQAVLAGRSVGEIETEVIAPCALDGEARAALWLYADGCLARAAAGHLPVIADNGVTGSSAPA